jgi:hypothetical protein
MSIPPASGGITIASNSGTGTIPESPMVVSISLWGVFIIPLIVSPLWAQTFAVETPSPVSESSAKLLMAATNYGIGGIGLHQFGRPSNTNFVLGGGILSATDFADRIIDGAVYSQRGVLLPLRFGIRSELYHQQLSSLDWAFYWVGTIGPVLVFGYPAGLDFQQSLSYMSVGLGGEVYNALGLEASFGSKVALYLEGGAYALTTFADRSLFKHANYFGPSMAVGIRTGF